LNTTRVKSSNIIPNSKLRDTNSLFSMEVAGGSMGCVAGLVGCHQAAAETTVVEDVPQEPVLAGLVVVLPSSAASCAAVGTAGSAAGQHVVVGVLVVLRPLHGHMEGPAVAGLVPAVP